MKPGTRVRFTDKATREQFGATQEEWDQNPKTGSVAPGERWRLCPKGSIPVLMDREWSYNEKDLTCWLQADVEYMDPDEIEEVVGEG